MIDTANILTEYVIEPEDTRAGICALHDDGVTLYEPDRRINISQLACCGCGEWVGSKSIHSIKHLSIEHDEGKCLISQATYEDMKSEFVGFPGFDPSARE